MNPHVGVGATLTTWATLAVMAKLTTGAGLITGASLRGWSVQPWFGRGRGATLARDSLQPVSPSPCRSAGLSFILLICAVVHFDLSVLSNQQH
eukprot:m.263029 g.263029  ORF g.263029 m.263029 type:complete len:93 (+) comp19235_c0_seq2:1376-1654(+)